MLMFRRIYFYFSVIVNIIIVSSGNYIHQELEGNLISQESKNFSLFIKHFTGIVFYGTDRSNKILIELEEENNEKRIIFKFNKFSITEKSRNLCGCPKCSDVYMTFILQLYQHQIVVKCNKQTQLLKINGSKIAAEQFNGYPIPKVSTSQFVTTFIWMGNIGPYRGSNHMEYFPLNNQLVGCLDKLYFNSKLINIEAKTSKFKSSCPTKYIENVHLKNYTKKSTISYKITDCSISSLNGRYCIRSINSFNNSLSKSSLTFNGELFFTRFEWTISSANQNLCLIEIILNDGSVILCYVKNNQGLEMSMSNEFSSFHQSKLLKELNLNETHSMIINFTDTEFVIKISSGDEINTFIQSLNSRPVSINIGISRKKLICKIFEGLMDFQYKIWYIPTKTTTISITSIMTTGFQSSFEFTKYSEKRTSLFELTSRLETKEEIKITSANIILITSSVFILFLILLFLFYVIIRKEMRSHIRKISVAVTSPVDQIQISGNFKSNPNVYELQCEHVYASSRDSAGYDIIPDNG